MVARNKRVYGLLRRLHAAVCALRPLLAIRKFRRVGKAMRAHLLLAGLVKPSYNVVVGLKPDLLLTGVTK